MSTITDSTGTRPCPRVRTNALKVKLYCRQVFSENPDYFRGDAIAQREFWLNHTDALCSAGLISQHQRDTWTCPF